MAKDQSRIFESLLRYILLKLRKLYEQYHWCMHFIKSLFSSSTSHYTLLQSESPAKRQNSKPGKFENRTPSRDIAITRLDFTMLNPFAVLKLGTGTRKPKKDGKGKGNRGEKSM